MKNISDEKHFRLLWKLDKPFRKYKPADCYKKYSWENINESSFRNGSKIKSSRGPWSEEFPKSTVNY